MTDKEVDPLIQTFINRLGQLDPGDRARLRRNAGKPLSEAKDVIGLFYHLLPHGIPIYQEETYFLVATLYPSADAGGKGDLGNRLKQAQNTNNNKGLDRRIEVLLDAEPTQMPFRLRQAIRYLRSCRVKIDWEQLLSDLLQWNHPDRFIQQRWARSYYAS